MCQGTRQPNPEMEVSTSLQMTFVIHTALTQAFFSTKFASENGWNWC